MTESLTATKGPQPKQRWIWVLPALLLAALALAPYLTAGRQAPIWIDEGVFAYMARASHETGQPIYVAGYDHKAPGIFLLYQAVQAFDQEGVWRARLVEGLMVLAAAVVLWLWLGRALSPGAGYFAALSLVCLLGYKPDLRALTEVPLVLGTVCGFACVWQGLRRQQAWWWMLAGVAFGWAFQFKQIAGLELCAALVLAVRYPREASSEARVRQGGALLLGWGAVFALALAYVAGTGQVREWWESAMVPLFNASTLYLPEERWGRVMSLLRHFWPNKALMLALLVAAVGLVWRGLRGHPLRPVLGAWLVAGLLGYLAAGTLFDHQAAQFFAPLAALLGAALYQAERWRLQRPTRGRGVAVGALTLAMLLPLLAVREWGMTRWEREADRQLLQPTGQWLNAHLPPGERMYVVGLGVPLYLYAERLAPLRTFHTLLLDEDTAGQVREELPRVRPGAVVFSPTFRKIERQLAEELKRRLSAPEYVTVRWALPEGWEVRMRGDLLRTPEKGRNGRG